MHNSYQIPAGEHQEYHRDGRPERCGDCLQGFATTKQENGRPEADDPFDTDQMRDEVRKTDELGPADNRVVKRCSDSCKWDGR